MLSSALRAHRKLVAVTVAVLVLLLGIWLGGHPSTLPSPLRSGLVENSNGQLVNQVLDLLARDYYRPVNRRQLVNRGLSAVLTSLGDPYSHYYDPSAYRAFLKSATNPHLSGIGVDAAADPSGLRIIDVFPGSPAASAGLQHGDVIVRVGTTALANRSADFASALIKGRAGTRVTLAVRRGRMTRVVSVVRASIVVPIATGKLVAFGATRLGLLKLTSFTDGSAAQLRAQTQTLLHGGARALILDLRENGGGLLQEAVRVGSIFIADGTIVSTAGRSQPRQFYVATGSAVSSTVPVVVLVDRQTASAAEIVTAALQERRHAKVVGTRTYGKGVFQEIQPLPNGGALDITVGEYFTPDGRNLGGGGVREGSGVQPDIYVRGSSSAGQDPALHVAEGTAAAEVR